MVSESDWLAALKVGDEVALKVGRKPPRIATVEKSTPAIVWVEGRRFPRATGKRAGDDYTRESIGRVDFDLRDGERRVAAINGLRSLVSVWDRRLSCVPTSRIEEALALLSPPSP